MIRLIIPVLGVFFIWLMFFSNFNRQRRIGIGLAVAALAIAGLWWEQVGNAPSRVNFPLTDLQECGVSAQHSYRTNFDVQFCLENLNGEATITRLELNFIALLCEQGQCRELQVVNRELPFILAPASRVTRFENLRFEEVPQETENVLWSVQPVAVHAVR